MTMVLNYRMTDIQAAMGVIQMAKINEILKQRKNKQISITQNS